MPWTSGEAALIIELVRYRLLGGSGLRVSELFLGTMTFGEDWGWGAPPEECRRMLDAYAEAGGNVVDTAMNYTDGASERIVGELLGSRREHFVVSTKYTLSTDPEDPNASGNHRKNLARSLELSLRRLGTDHIDIYWVHIWDPNTPDRGDDAGARRRSPRRQGPLRRRVRHPGLGGLSGQHAGRVAGLEPAGRHAGAVQPDCSATSNESCCQWRSQRPCR